jgi:hypothetical protein
MPLLYYGTRRVFGEVIKQNGPRRGKERIAQQKPAIDLPFVDQYMSLNREDYSIKTPGQGRGRMALATLGGR